MSLLKVIFNAFSKRSTIDNHAKKNDCLELNKQIDKLADKYFKNLHAIETAWKQLRESNYPPHQRDDFWQLCIIGRRYFWDWITAERKRDPNYYVPPTVPCYKRAVMLLEHEERWDTAIDICKQALEWIDSEWYSNKIERFRKKVKS